MPAQSRRSAPAAPARTAPARSARPRKPGRPPGGGGGDQRERLLDAALASFAAHGITATSLRKLASAAGVTPAMLNYYFGARDRLVAAVVEERLMPVMAELTRRLEAQRPDGGLASAVAFVRALHETIVEHPWLPALWVREVLSEGGGLRKVFTERIGPGIALPLSRSLAQSQREGALNSALEPRLLFVSLVGLTMLPFAAAPIWRRALTADDIDAATMLEHTLALLDSGLQP